jgi:spore maturation protein CgeB
MRIVYAGELDHGGTCYARLRALQDIESDVIPFDVIPFFEGRAKWERILERVTLTGSRFARANASFRALCREHDPDIVWIDKGIWVSPSTIEELRSRGCFLAQHNTDALYHTRWRVRRSYRGLRATLPSYDLYFTTNLQDFHRLSQGTKPRTELTYLGYDHLRFNAARLTAELLGEWRSELLFVGHHEPRTEAMVLGLIEAGLPVTVYGVGWERAREKKRLRGHVQFRPLADEEYVCALKATKIGLCFVSEMNGNQTAGRSFEIPACGTFLLAMRTPQHRECYEEGVEAEFFGDIPELVQKAKFYLDHDERRLEIARRGRLRCQDSDYSWARYMREDWSKLQQVIGGGTPGRSAKLMARV